MSYLERLIEAQNKDLYSARSYLERAETEKRELSVEERTAWDALNAQMDNRQDHINEVRGAEMRDAKVAEAMSFAPEVRTDAVRSDVRSDSDILRAMARGEIRSHTFERRALDTDTSTKGPETVPQGFLSTIQQKLLTTGPMLDGSVINLLNTNSGNDIKVPVQSTRPTGTAVAEGATVVTGGGSPKMADELKNGHWVQPTIWTGLPETATVIREEIFGPCCHIAPFDTEEEAIALANNTTYGLATSVWTENIGRAHRMAEAIEVGLCWINSWFLRDLRTPFGGAKGSGIGREGGVHSLEFYTELRNVCVKL